MRLRASLADGLLEVPEEAVDAVGEAEHRCERLGRGDPSAQATAGKDQPRHALGMTSRELEDRAASGREPDHDGALDPEMVDQQGVGVRLVRRRGAFGQRGTEVPEARRSDDSETGPRKVRPPAVDGIDVASEDAVRYQERHALALIGVLDRAEARLQPMRGERVDAVPTPGAFPRGMCSYLSPAP